MSCCSSCPKARSMSCTLYCFSSGLLTNGNIDTANFYVAYNQWLKELKGNQRSFVPFNLNTDNLKDCITDVKPQSGFLKSPLDYKKITSVMNAASPKAVKSSRFGANDVPKKLFCLLNETLDKLIEEKYISVI